MDIYLSENTIRKIIRQELEEVLFEQTASDEQKANKELGQQTVAQTKPQRDQAKTNLAKIFGATAIAAFAALADLPTSEAQIEFEDPTMKLSNVVEEKQQELKQYGLTEDGTAIIINFALKTAQADADKDKNYLSANEQDKQNILVNKQIEEIQKIKDINVAKNILILQFDNKISNIGWKITTNPEEFGAATPVTAAEFGATYLAHQTKSGETDIVKYDEKTGKASFNPADLSYWDQYVIDGGTMDKKLHNVFGDLKVQPFVYNFVVQQSAGISPMEQIPESEL